MVSKNEDLSINGVYAKFESTSNIISAIKN